MTQHFLGVQKAVECATIQILYRDNAEGQPRYECHDTPIVS